MVRRLRVPATTRSKCNAAAFLVIHLIRGFSCKSQMVQWRPVACGRRPHRAAGLLAKLPHRAYGATAADADLPLPGHWGGDQLGQRIWGFESPGLMKTYNVQGEANVRDLFGYLADHVFIAGTLVCGGVLPLLWAR